VAAGGLFAAAPKRLTNVRQQIRKIFFADVFFFVVIFFAVLFNSLSTRSIVFDVVVGILLAAKCLLCIVFDRERTVGALRSYFIARYAFDAFLICPALVILRAETRSQLS